ncbi:MAG TPA: ankyrin repeat domain-containing protein [Patescibacteria group bacterium]|nr:ankyrin repeat domain-containing protein [Patescibacteria group bacterium]
MPLSIGDDNDFKSLGALLLEAAARKDAREVAVLLAAGADPNFGGADGVTALHLAAKAGDVAILDALLAHPRVDVNARDEDVTSPLMEAARAGHPTIIEKLIAKGADHALTDKHHRNALMMAAHNNKPDAIRMLLKKGANANAQTEDGGYTALHFATSRSHYAAVIALAGGGADPTIPNKAGITPLDLAQRFDQSEPATQAMTHFMAAAGVGKYLKSGATRTVIAPVTARFKKHEL